MTSFAENPAAIPNIPQMSPAILRGDETLMTTPLVHVVTSLKHQTDAFDQLLERSEQTMRDHLEGDAEDFLKQLAPVLAYAHFRKANRAARAGILTEVEQVHARVCQTSQDIDKLNVDTIHLHGKLREFTAQHTAAESRTRPAYEEAQMKHQALETADKRSGDFLATHSGTEAVNFSILDYEARAAQQKTDYEASTAFAKLAIDLATLEAKIGQLHDDSGEKRSQHARLKPLMDNFMRQFNALVERYNGVWQERNETSLAHYAVEWANRGAQQPLKPEELSQLGELVNELAGVTHAPRGRHAHPHNGHQPQRPLIRPLIAPVRTMPAGRKFGLESSRNDNWRVS